MEWIRGPIIGCGSTATVSLATVVQSGEVFAVKSTELSRSTFLQREQRFLSQLSCPHIVKYKGFDISYEGNKPVYNLCMEYVPGGTLFDAIQRHQGGRLDEALIRAYTTQILEGLEYLHAFGLVHCDIKSQNILIGKDASKIADLGCAKLVGNVAGNGDPAISPICGTPMFMAPEVARGEEQGFPADIWALGCTIIEMATGSTPWPEMNDPVSALYRIGFSDDVPELPRFCSENAKDFLTKCLRRDPRERWTAKELLGHPFLTEIDPHTMEAKQFTAVSPSSVLEHGFWDSSEVLECPRNRSHEGTSSNSPAERIKGLIGGTVPSVSCVPNWSWDEDWVTVRSNGIEENEKFSGQLDMFLENEDSVATAFVIVLGTQLECFFDSISTIISIISIRRGSVPGCESVKDDIVLKIPNSETENENICILPTQLLSHLNPKPIQCNLILFLQIYLFYNLSSGPLVARGTDFERVL
ncbi:mitogen-activated protein kinase kinase kinase 18 [Carya illinoinensis]|uniref:Protein kinase domain-containing protein n=1 Tax=Carya illinoinensis TaxID=32201 RepID=A0A8T1P028_CARIL|nr:mitogen-activated protein kinase kinase kinase 18 [Carya illinoinensis]KAG6634643.1 hypothetical protein CIPAW_12G131700 [Carya illinoinensis]KAG6685813.1 hypothetical protein I3842_12G130600 [Carya illinoinensis]